MAKAKKLPSGKWRAQVYSHTDSTGKKIRMSFTASTKAEAEMMAAKFKADTDRRRDDDLTIKEAVNNYLEANENVLSSSTIYNYKKDAKSFQPIEHLKIRKLTSNDLQRFISSLVDQGLSPKTIKNRYGLLRTVIAYCHVDKKFVIHLPSQPRKPKYAPEDEQIKRLYDEANRNMKVAIMLAAFHSLRRGEVCGLKYGDLKGNTLYVHSDVVKSADGKEWVHKETPKTDVSNRTIYLTDKELEIIGTGNKDDYIVPLTPGSVGTEFYYLKKKVGIDIRFHDLRGYFSSVAAAVMPDIYLSHLGGWREGSQVLKQSYQKPIKSLNEHYAQKLNDRFESVIGAHESSHKNQKGAI